MFNKTDSLRRTGAAQSRVHAPGHACDRRKREPMPIGPSMHLNGDLRGDDDIVVYGHLQGSVDIGEGRLVVTREGRVDADVRARVIAVEGRIEGDLHASEQIIVRKSARVRGTITAPRVALDFGCEFSGVIDTSVDDAAQKNAPSALEQQNIADFKAAISPTGDRSARSAMGKRSPR
jgi:cytoskeletal protein CcmA (bactofilin family)